VLGAASSSKPRRDNFHEEQRMASPWLDWSRRAIHSAAGTRGCSEASYRLGSQSHFDTIDHTSLVKLCASVGLRSTHAGLIRLWLKASMPSCTKRAEAGRRRGRFCSRRFYDFGDACSAASISGAHLYRVRPSARRPVTI
jgi:hypothetical protein